MDKKHLEPKLATEEYVDEYVSIASNALVAGFDRTLKALKIEIMTDLDRIISRIDAVEKTNTKSHNKNHAE